MTVQTQIIMRSFSKISPLLLWLYVANASEPSKPQKNFILFQPDEMRAESLGCYGHPVSKTPNFDAFAKEGTRFDQAHVSYTGSQSLRIIGFNSHDCSDSCCVGSMFSITSGFHNCLAYPRQRCHLPQFIAYKADNNSVKVTPFFLFS